MDYCENLLTVGDVAKSLMEKGVEMTSATVRWHADQGNLPYQRTAGGNRLFHPQDVRKFAESRISGKQRQRRRESLDQEARGLIKVALRVPSTYDELGRSDVELVKAAIGVEWTKAKAVLEGLQARVARIEKNRA